LVNEGVIDYYKLHDDQGHNIGIAPQHNRVVSDSFDLLEVLVEEVEAP